MKISYIIVTKDRSGMLERHLHELSESVMMPHEIIVSDDGSEEPLDLSWYSDERAQLKYVRSDTSGGPNAARNRGIAAATGSVLLIVGDDALPSSKLVMAHWLAHQQNRDVPIVQGLTVFHPQAMDTEFMQFLDRAGFQANWNALRKRDGRGWKRDSTGFFLTTNVSLKRWAFDYTGLFSEAFVDPAWDDIEFGLRAQKLGIKSIFEPRAMNFHLHKYDLAGFCRRQRMEGRNRWRAASHHPEMATGLVVPELIRGARQSEYSTSVHKASSLERVPFGISTEEKNKWWSAAIQLSSAVGLVDWIDSTDEDSVFRLLEFFEKKKSAYIIFQAHQSFVERQFAHVAHCVYWLQQQEPENWATFAAGGRLSEMIGKSDDARVLYQHSLALNPTNFVHDRLEKIGLLND